MKMANILQLTVMGTMQSINSEQIAHTKNPGEVRTGAGEVSAGP